MAMAPLGMVLLIQSERGSYALAGIVTGAFAVGTAVGAPFRGRLEYRSGQARVIVPIVVLSALMIATLALGAAGGFPNWLLLALSGATGLSFPPFSAAMRVTWRTVLPEGPARRAGFALDAVAVESIFVGGPLLLSLLLVIGPPEIPLLVTAVLLAGGGLTYCATGPARRRAEPSPAGVAAAMTNRGLSSNGTESGAKERNPALRNFWPVGDGRSVADGART